MGLDIGLEEAGFEILLACEHDKHCQNTIRVNRPDIPIISDIRDYSAEQVMELAGLELGDHIDLMAGGPPCQAFSTAGRRQGFNDDRGHVFLKYLELCFEIKPEFFILENVRGLLSCPMSHRPHDLRGDDHPPLSHDELAGGALNFVLDMIRKGGYGFSFNLYNSANYGVPQKRERVIIVCSKDGSISPFIPPTHDKASGFGLAPWVPLKEAWHELNTCTHIEFPEKRLHYYRMLKAGQNWRNLPLDLQEEALGKSYHAGGGKTGFFRRVGWNEPSPTLVTHPAMPATDLCHPVEDRPLSVEEYARIQQFPDDWNFQGSIKEQYKQIGNAVPVGLGRKLGEMVIDLLDGNEVPVVPGFTYSRYKDTDQVTWQRKFAKAVEKHMNENGGKQLSILSYGQDDQ